MKKVFYLSLASVAAIGSIFTAVTKADNKTDVKAEYRVMANDGNCYDNPYDCADTVIITVPSEQIAS